MLNVGDILDGRYQVIRLLGVGGMSSVYLCKNTRLDNLWAVKEVTKGIMKQMGFIAEPDILKGLNHPGIPRIIDIFNEDENLYIVEDYIQGKTLEDMVKGTGPMDVHRICEVVLSLCNIIGYLHSLNPPVIFRDLKPSNIMITPDGGIMLIDFGISRIYKDDQEHDTVYFGTNGYAAPEQYGKAQSCKRTDVYGLGATMYFMATGRVPPYCIDRADDLEGHRLKDIIKRAAQIEVEDRYASIDEIKEHILSLYNDTDKTTVINMKNKVDKTKKMVFDTPMPNEGPVKVSVVKKDKLRRITGKLIASIIIIMMVALIAEYLMMNHSNGPVIASGKTVDTGNSANKDNVEAAKPEDKTGGTPVKTVSIQGSAAEGTIDLGKPMVLGNNTSGSYDFKSKGKAKGKGKSSSYSNVQDDLFYEVSPEASLVKYDGKLVMKLVYIEQRGPDLIAYCRIENNTGKTVGISHSNTYLFNDQARYVQADDESTDASKIPSGSGERDVAIIFRDFTLDTKVLVLASRTVSSDPGYNNGEIRLTVNVKQ